MAPGDSRAMPKWNPARLFERLRPEPHHDDEASLDAVARGTKGMSMFVSSEGDLPHWVVLAAKRSLVVALHVDGTSPKDPIHVFLAKPEELWRVPAYLALWNTAFVDGRWSDASENLAGHLLGYTKAQRKAWLAARRHAQPAWTCATIYAVLSAEQRDVVEALGRRCFGADRVTLFRHRGTLKPTAFAQIPRDHTLARAGLASEVADRLFGSKDSTKTLSATRINAALRSNVEFLTRSGWR